MECLFQDNYDETLRYLDKCVEIYETEITHSPTIDTNDVYLEMSLGMHLMTELYREEDYEKSLQSIEKGLAILQKIEDIPHLDEVFIIHQSIFWNNQALVYQEQGKESESTELLENAITVVSDISTASEALTVTLNLSLAEILTDQNKV